MKRHYDATPPDAVLSHSLCPYGYGGVTTTEPGAVTCSVCRSKLARAHNAEASEAAKFEGEYVHDTDFIEATRDPLPVGTNLTRAQRAAWRHVFDGVARVIMSETDRERSRPQRETRFAGVTHALAELVRAATDGAPMGSVGDPKRLLRQSCFGSQRGVGRRLDRGLRQVEDLHHVRQAWDAAYDGEWGGVLDERECREICLRRYVGDEGPKAIAADISGRTGRRVTTKLVGRVSRAGFGRIWEHLRDRELIPHGRQRRTEGTMGKGDVTPCDLFGWRQIAEYLGVHQDTAKDWYRNDGLPVYHFKGRVETRSEELREWRRSRTTRGVGANEGTE